MSDVQATTPAITPPNGASPQIWTIVVAGGSGRRFGTMKQYEMIDDRRVLDHAIGVALSSSDGVVVAVPVDDVADETTIHAPYPQVRVVPGGPTRTASVRNGLTAVPADATMILVHDAARPFATEHLYRSVIAAVVSGADGSVPGLPVVDTVKVIEVAHSSVVDAVVPHVVSTPDRATLVAVQTPQAFRAEILRRAYIPEIDGTDDSSLVEAIGGTVIVVSGEANNRKITHPEDLVWAREFIASKRASS
jgi:2-C-methyl-D-erythritol 4-phosphate cytidylyltransferase